MLLARLPKTGQLSRGMQDRDLAAANCRQSGARSRQEPAHVILEEVGGDGRSFNERGRALPTQQRSVFLLRFAEEMSLAQIADVLDVKVGTVKAQLARATGKLREMKERQWR